MATIENAPAGENTSPASSLKIPLSDDYFVQIANLLKNYVASPAQGMIFYYNGTNWTGLATGTSGLVLKTQGAGANPAWGLPADLVIASQAQGDILYFNGTNWVRLAAGTSGKFLKTLGAGANPAWDTDRIVQAVHTQTGAVATGTVIIPVDDTIPQNTEGDEYMTLAITPTNASNKLVIEVIWIGSNTVSSQFAVALFQDSTANALAVSTAWQPTAAGNVAIPLRHEMVAGTTSPTTFKIRAGGHAAGTTTFNGFSGGRIYGGRLASSIRITEVKV